MVEKLRVFFVQHFIDENAFQLMNVIPYGFHFPASRKYLLFSLWDRLWLLCSLHTLREIVSLILVDYRRLHLHVKKNVLHFLHRGLGLLHNFFRWIIGKMMGLLTSVLAHIVPGVTIISKLSVTCLLIQGLLEFVGKLICVIPLTRLKSSLIQSVVWTHQALWLSKNSDKTKSELSATLLTEIGCFIWTLLFENLPFLFDLAFSGTSVVFFYSSCSWSMLWFSARLSLVSIMKVLGTTRLYF